MKIGLFIELHFWLGRCLLLALITFSGILLIQHEVNQKHRVIRPFGAQEHVFFQQMGNFRIDLRSNDDANLDLWGLRDWPWFMGISQR
jgi:hypothetical protein